MHHQVMAPRIVKSEICALLFSLISKTTWVQSSHAEVLARGEPVLFQISEKGVNPVAVGGHTLV